MRGAENLVLQEGQAARRETSREHSRQGPQAAAQGVREITPPFRFRLDFVLPAPPSVPGAPDTRCLLRRFPVQV